MAPLVVRNLVEAVAGDRYRRSSSQAGIELDRLLGIETSEIAELADLEVRGENRALGVRYEPTSPALFATAMRRLRIDPGDYSFVDYGCGKGRALVLAAEHGFRNITGVEFAPRLCELAEANCRAYERARPSDSRTFQIACMDASVFVPPGEKCVFFCYNAFHEQLVRAVLENLETSLRTEPRDVFFVYVNPQWRRLFDRSDLFERHSGSVWSPEWFVTFRARAPLGQ